MPCYARHWEAVAPFLQELAQEGLVPSFSEREPLEGTWKTLEVAPIPFISYPYEWSFSQLKAAALLTLSLQERALARGLVLKDASAYNVQFVGARPIFVDLLSFEGAKPNQPWSAYQQFCMHFLAPLALISWANLKSSFLAQCGDGRSVAQKARAARVGKDSLVQLVNSLKSAVTRLTLPSEKTSWGDYCTDTNYTNIAAQRKTHMVQQVAERLGGGGNMPLT
ncbi:MAG: hypothetical protein LBJ70_02305 [Holosporales bacterium]|jgi:hypothetical protein|nr:hypothetical protein [Holosporales bacterium]